MGILEADAGAGFMRLRIKAVPGAKRDAIVGVLGDRLKVRVSAPPEDGRANRAICELIERTIGVKSARVELIVGASSAEKVVCIRHVDEATIRRSLGID